jgi:hypothetical protein
VTTTDIDYAGLAKKAASNWRKFQCFSWWGKPEVDPENWAVFYTMSRDSGLLDVSNHHAIATALDKFDEGDEPTLFWQDHSHFAVGWVTAAVIRVYDADGNITEVFRAWAEFQARLEDYPVLDETDYSNREYDAALEGIREQGRRQVIDNPPEHWPSQVYEWLSEHCDRELENRDDRGAYPSEGSIREALTSLGLLDAVASR